MNKFCEVCKSPAVIMVIDEKEIPSENAKRFLPYERHYFCQEHKRKHITYELDARYSFTKQNLGIS